MCFSVVLQAACHTSLKWWSRGIMSWPSIRISWLSWSSRITIAFPPCPSWNPRTLTMFSLSWQTVFTCRTLTSPSRAFEYMVHHGKFLMHFLCFYILRWFTLIKSAYSWQSLMVSRGVTICVFVLNHSVRGFRFDTHYKSNYSSLD